MIIQSVNARFWSEIEGKTVINDYEDWLIRNVRQEDSDHLL